MVGLFTPQGLANATNQGFPPPREPVMKQASGPARRAEWADYDQSFLWGNGGTNERIQTKQKILKST